MQSRQLSQASSITARMLSTILAQSANEAHLILALVRVRAPHPDLVSPEVAGDEGDDLLHVDALACGACNMPDGLP